jgi:hypothetical protein
MDKYPACWIGNNPIENEKNCGCRQGPDQHDNSRVEPEAIQRKRTKEDQCDFQTHRNLQQRLRR